MLHKGESFDSSQIEKYSKNDKVEFLYFKTKDRALYINYINQVLEKNISSSNMKTETVVKTLRSVSDKYIEEIYTMGLKPQLLEEGRKICQNMYNVIQKNNDLALILRQYEEYDPPAYAHLFLVSFFSAVIIKNLEWASSRTAEIVAMAGLVHDIGKLKLPPELREINPTQMSPQQKSLYFKHPLYDFDLSVKGSINKSNFSDRSYTDENGTSASLGRGNSQTSTEYLNLRGKYKPLYINYIKDNYKTENIVLWGDLENTPGSGVIRKPVPKEYLTDVYQIGYQDDISDQVNLHLYYQNKVQYPYLQPDTKNEVSLGNSWRRKVERKLYGVKSLIKFNEKSNLSLGSEISEDISYSLNRLTYTGAPDVFGHNNSNKAQIQNLAVFGQYEQQTDIANFTAGVRCDKPSAFDSTVVPRLGVTKVLGKAHVKALFAKAFRSPVIENISLNKDIKPEITTTSELEFGYQFNRHTNWNLNLFSTQVKDAIVYSYDSATVTENYTNYDYVKTLGLETELHFKHDIHNIKFSYSTYKVDSLNAVPYKTSKDSSALVGSPRHKVFIRDTINVSKKIDVTPSFIYLSNTNSYKWDGTQFSEARLEDQFITNVFGNYKDFIISGFDIGLGINNILNSNLYFAQPYVKQGDYRSGAYPDQSREYILKLAYTKEF